MKSTVKTRLMLGAGTLVSAATGRRRKKLGLHRPVTREALLRGVDPNHRVLEIGPFDSPLLRGSNVAYFDVLDRSGLQQLARKYDGRVPENCPDIDYVSPNGDLSIVRETFDVIVSAHAIEHQPDLVRHLSDVAGLLNDNGVYIVICPDKRFCFDHYSPESSLGDVLAASFENRKVHSVASIVNTLIATRTTHNRGIKHWLGIHGPAAEGPLLDGVLPDVKKVLDTHDGSYDDAHAWRFTPESFRRIVRSLHELDLIDLTVNKVADTRFGQIEFCAVLGKRTGKD